MHGAIAYNPTSHRVAHSYKLTTKEDAQARALQEAGHGSRLVVSVSNGYGALAIGSNGVVAGGGGSSSSDAQLNAFNACASAGGTNCKIACCISSDQGIVPVTYRP